jgi:hypothetical protein
MLEYMQPTCSCLREGFAHEVGRNASDLDIHLQGSHPIPGTGDFEIHVAQMIFQAENIGEDENLIAFLD